MNDQRNITKKAFLYSLLIGGLFAFLFYDSVWGLVLIPFWIVLIQTRMKQEEGKKDQRLVQKDFFFCLEVVEESIQAGMSLESAWKEAEEELGRQKKEGGFYQAIVEMNRSICMNQPLEKCFGEMANRIDEEEILRFAEILDYGKRSGGNWNRIISESIKRMQVREATMEEIEVLLAEKSLEQRIMSIVPLGMILFLRLGSAEYLEVLYETLFGRILMTVGLIVYVFAVRWSEKMMEIRV